MNSAETVVSSSSVNGKDSQMKMPPIELQVISTHPLTELRLLRTMFLALMRPRGIKGMGYEYGLDSQ